ncbi:MAG: ParA family protein [Bacilli bacterium]
MIISVVNNKGGVLKTTLSTNLASCLSLKKKKVMLIDLDGQGNVVATFGKNPYNLKNTVVDYLKGEIDLKSIIIKEKPFLDIIPSNDQINYFDILLNKNLINISSLKNLLFELNKIYDYVIIDTPPNMSTIVAIVLSISDVVLIPFEPDQYAILGLKRIVDASKDFMIKNGKEIKIIAIPTKVNNRVTIHNEIINDIIKPKLSQQDVYISKNFISSSTKSTSSVGYEKVPIVFSIIKSKYQNEYFLLTDEILEKISENKNGK